MITALLIDDEENNRDALRTLLNKHCPNITVVDTAGGADEAFIKIKKHKPRLIFLDIKMPGKSGFELLKMFTEIDFEVIFVTAFDNYAINAFEFNALGYILKPISPQKLKSTVDKVKARLLTNDNEGLVFHFVQTLSDKNDLVNKFSVHHNGKVVFINIPEISFIEAMEDTTKISLKDNTYYYSSKDLIKFENVLKDTGNFIRISKNLIINASFIKNYSKGEFFIIEMQSGQSFEVSRRRKGEILKKLKPI